MSFQNFSELKSNRDSILESLKEKAQSLNTQKNYSADERFWTPTLDQAQNSHAIIRFLPAPQGEDFPFVRYWDHGFQGPGGWYIEKSRTSLGEDDPVSEMNSKLWNSGSEANKNIARSRKRRLNHVANIYVVSDPANPDAEGKVFLYRFGKKIMDMIQEKLFPEFDDEEAVNVFDFWKGANFRLRIRNVDGWRNYDKSTFDEPTALLEGSDEALQAVWNSQYNLNEFIDPNSFKSYEELKSRMLRVLGEDGTLSPETSAEQNVSDDQMEMKLPESEPAWTPPEAKTAVTTEESEESEDDELEWFKGLAE